MKTLIFSVTLFLLTSPSWADLVLMSQNTGTTITPMVQLSDTHPSGELSTQLQKIVVDHPSSVKPKQNAVLNVRTQTTGWVNKFKPDDFDRDLSIDEQPLLHEKKKEGKYAGFINAVSPDYIVNRNFLSLTKVPQDRRKRAIMFVFFMNKPKADPNKVMMAKNSMRSRLHIMAPKRVVTEQKVVDDEYPLDVSIARYDDGYSADEWNLVLPNKKPREIFVSLLWNF